MAYGWQNTQISLPTGVAIKVTARGKLRFDVNPNFEPCAHNPPPSIPNDVGPAGLNSPNRPYAVLMCIGTATNAPGSTTTLQPPLDVGSDSSWSFITGPGVLWVERPTVVLSSCQGPGTGYQPAYFVSGGQSVDATVLPPPSIEVDKQTVVDGDTVSAQPVAAWSTDILVWGGWTWVNDNGSTAGATFVAGSGCLSRSLTCKVIPHGDGHLYMPSLTVSQIGQSAVSPVIHVAPAHLTLTVDNSHVPSGAQVQFTARRTDNQPVQVDSWVWTQAGSPPGPVSSECAGGDSICVSTLVNTTPAIATAPQTGTMTAWATLGTASESASVAVTVDPPPVDSGGACGGSAVYQPSGSRTPTGTRIGTPSGAVAATVCYPPPPGGTVSLVLVMNHDTLNPLYPRIRGLRVNDIQVPEREPDTASVQVSLAQNGTPVPAGTPVTIRAEWLPATGGHAHIENMIRFEGPGTPLLATGPEKDWPLFGYFLEANGLLKARSIQLGTNASGVANERLVAGYMGGRARVIASASVNGQVVADTSIVGYGVSGLVNLQSRIAAGVYWIGGRPAHPQGFGWYVQDSVVARLSAISDSLQDTVSGIPLYPQFNDASLPNGGTYSVRPEPVAFEDPFANESQGHGHVAHNTGLDVDIGLCYAQHQGNDNQVHRVSNCDPDQQVDEVLLGRIACQQHGKESLHFGNHYHIRFVGRNDNVPGCSL